MDLDKLNENILIDLDSLIDTRLPVVYALHSETAADLVQSGMYHKRIKDVFGNIPYRIFRRYYDDRTKDILRLATPTPMVDLLKSYCIEAYESHVTQGIDMIPTLYVNTYPYVLNETEEDNLLKLFYNLIDVRVNIVLIHLDRDKLTPEYIDKHVVTVIMYDMVDWLEYHSAKGNLAKYPLLKGSCVGPLLANGDKPSSELTQDDFEQLRATFGPLCNLVLLQSRQFSTA